MKAAQILRYSKDIHVAVNDVPVPEIGDDELLIRVKAVAVNPVDILNLTGAVRLIQDYNMPLTLGNECAGIDYVIDTLGDREFEHELSVLRGNGILLSLRGMPNGAFAEKNSFPFVKRFLFTLAGAKYDRKAKQQAKAYRFLFVRSDGAQLEKITGIVEANHIVPKIDPREFDLSQINDALKLVANGHIDGKVVLRFS